MPDAVVVLDDPEEPDDVSPDPPAEAEPDEPDDEPTEAPVPAEPLVVVSVPAVTVWFVLVG